LGSHISTEKNKLQKADDRKFLILS